MGVVVASYPGGVVKVVQGTTSQVVTAGVAILAAGNFSPPNGTGFIHVTAGLMDGTARNPLASEVPGFDNVTVSGIPVAGYVVVASDATHASWQELPAVDVTPGTAGQIFITNSGPNAVWTSLVSVELTHGRFQAGGSGSDFEATIGPHVGAETAFASLWLQANGVALTSNNYVITSDATSVLINTPNVSGTHYFYAANSTLRAHLSAAALVFDTVPLIQFSETLSPTITSVARTSDAACHDTAVNTQPAFASSTGTNRRPGSFIVNVGAPATGADFEGGFVVQGSGTALVKVGYYAGPDTTYGAIWLGAAAITSNDSNFSLLGNGGSLVYLNAPASGGQINLSFDGTAGNGINIANTSVVLQTIQTILGGPSLSSLAIGTNKSAATLVLQAGAASTVATLSSTEILMASGTHLSLPGTVATTALIRAPNNVAIMNGRNAGNTSDINILIIDASDQLNIGDGGVGGNMILWAPTSKQFTFNNAPAIAFGSGTTSPIVRQDDNATNSATGQALTVHAQNATGTTSTGGDMLLSSGTGTSAHGSARLQVGANDVLKLSNPTGSILKAKQTGYWLNSFVTKASNYTINSSAPGDNDVWLTAAATYTLPTPEAGMTFRLIVAYDPTVGGGTIARHGGENINGAAANITLGATDKWSILFVSSNGTDWVIKGALGL